MKNTGNTIPSENNNTKKHKLSEALRANLLRRKQSKTDKPNKEKS